MIKKLMMLCVAAMAATGFAEIWGPRASEIQFEGVKLPDGTSSGLLVAGSNAVAKVKLEQFSPGWRVFDEEYNEYTGLRAQRHVIEKIILIGYPGAVLNDLPMPKLSDYMPNGWNQEGYLEYQKQYNKAARMFKEDSFGNILHISPANNRIEFEFQLAPIDAIASSYRIIHSGEVNIGQIEFDDSSNICSNKNWFLLPLVLPNGKGYHGEYYWTAHVVYSDYEKQANEEGDGYLWSEDLITFPNMEKVDEEGSKCLLLITNELGRVFFDKFGKDDGVNPNWLKYWEEDGACPSIKTLKQKIKIEFSNTKRNDGRDANYGATGDRNVRSIWDVDKDNWAKFFTIWLWNRAAGMHYADERPANNPNMYEPGLKITRADGNVNWFGGAHVFGIYTVEGVLAHENTHRETQNPYLFSGHGKDSDYRQYIEKSWIFQLVDWVRNIEFLPECDYLDDQTETSKYSQHRFSITSVDTHNLKNQKDSQYGLYGDNEYLCLVAGNENYKNAIAENDWAFPGEQSCLPEMVVSGRNRAKAAGRWAPDTLKCVVTYKGIPNDDNLGVHFDTVTRSQRSVAAQVLATEAEIEKYNSVTNIVEMHSVSMKQWDNARSYCLEITYPNKDSIGIEGFLMDSESNVVASAWVAGAAAGKKNKYELNFDLSDNPEYAQRKDVYLGKLTFKSFSEFESVVEFTAYADFDSGAEVEHCSGKADFVKIRTFEEKGIHESISSNGLELAINVNVEDAGRYQLVARLATTNHMTVASFGSHMDCVAGSNRVNIVFNAEDIYESSYDLDDKVPYVISSLELFKEDGVRVDSRLDFYTFNKLFEGETFSYVFDDDGSTIDFDELYNTLDDYIPSEDSTVCVMFHSNGGRCDEFERCLKVGDVIGVLPTPIRNGYVFEGWYTKAEGGSAISASTVVSDYVIFFARWSNNDPVEISYTVTFDANGGVVSPLTHSVEHNMAIGNLPTPTRSKYKFLGWYTAPEGGTKVTATTKVTGDVTYYAQWVYDGLTTVTAVIAEGCEAMGRVTGGKTAKAGTKLTLKATANKGYVFSHWEGPLGDEIDSRNPSISYVVGEVDAEFIAHFIPVKDDVAAISFMMPKDCPNGVAIDHVLVDVSGCASLPTVKVTGLPTGLKFTAVDILKKGSKTEIEVPANTIYGTPTKSGVYTVVATVTTAGKKSATCSQTVIVRKEGEKVVVAECDVDGGKVTGGGVYATGKNVALKATANKGYVFAGWYYSRTAGSAVDGVNAQAARSTGDAWSADLIPCDSTLIDYRNPNYSYMMGAEDKTFYARFESVEEDTNLSLTVDGVAITPEDTPIKSFTVGSATNLPFVIDSLSLPKATVKGLPTGMKFTEKAVMKKGSKTEIEIPANTIYGTPTKPGVYKVSVSLTNTSIKKAVINEFEIVVPNLTDGLIQVEDEYGPYVPGVAYTNTIATSAGCTVSGLPAGMKWTAKDILDNKTKLVAVPANSAYGVPTKPGKYTVYFTKTVDKVKHTATATFVVGDFPVVNVVTVGSGTGKVTGVGAFAANKKVTLKATADTKDDAKKGTKKSVFAGWYLDADGLSPVESTVDFRTASLPYVMTAEPETTLYALFVTAEEDSDIMLYIKDKEITVNANDNNFVAEGTTILSLQMESISIPKATLSGLPAGMKYTDKALTVKATKTEEAYDVPANAIYGTPTKPGVYIITVKLTNTTIKKAIEKKFTIEVPNLTAANRYFVDYLYNDISEKYTLSVGITNIDEFLPSLALNSGTTKLAVSGLPSGLKYDAKSGKITGIATRPGTYTVTLTVTEGKAKYVSTITVEVEPLPEILIGTYTGLIGRDVNVGNDDPWMAYGMANVTVTANGKITAKMTLPCGAYSFSAAGWDYVEDGVYFAVMRTKKGDEFELVIDSKRNWKEVAEDSALLIDGYKEFRVPLWRNEHVKGGNIESDSIAKELISEIKALKKVAFKVEGSKSSGYEVTEVASNDRSANLIVTFDTKGGVKYAGNFDGVRVSGSTFLCIDDDGYYTICDIVVPVGKTESVYIAFGIERDEDGELQFEVDVIRSEFQE